MEKIKYILIKILNFLKLALDKFFAFITPKNIYSDEDGRKRFRKCFLIVISAFIIQGFITLIIIYITVKTGGKAITLMNVEGMPKTEAVSLLEKNGFNVSIEEEIFPEYEDETVIVQNPKADVNIKKGRTINLIVSKKNTTVIMPDLSGLKYKEALNVITNSIMSKDIGVTILEAQYAYDRTKAIGVVIAQNPVPSKVLSSNISIELVINSTNVESSVSIANFVGANFLNAISFLEKNGLSTKIQTENVTPDMIDKVISQSVPAGNYKLEDIETPIVITVGIGEDETIASNVRRIGYTVPLDKTTGSMLKIILEDDRGTKTLYEKKVTPGSKVSFIYSLRGLGTIKIYYDNELYETSNVE